MEVPTTETEIFELMDKGHQITDAALQKSQSLQAIALGSILRILNSNGNGRGGLTEQHLEGLLDANRVITMSFSSVNQIRKELIRNCLGWPIAKLCTWSTPVGTSNLFPDLNRRLTERDTTRARLGRRNKYQK